MICETVAQELEELVAATAAAEEEPAAAGAGDGAGTPEEAAQEGREARDAGAGEAGEDAAPRPGTPALRRTEYAKVGYHLDVTVAASQVVAAAETLDRHRFFLETITGVDWPADGQMEVVYDFKHSEELCRVVVRARVDRDDPHLPTISHVFPGANWHERETHDFFGIVFDGHPHLVPLLLPEDADFHPLRKDFSP